MKHVFRNLVIAALLVAWTGLLHAETNGPSAKPPTRLKLDCEIVKVNAEAKSVEIKADGKTETLTLSEKCKVRINGEDKALSDLKPGDKCHCVVYEKKDGSKSVSRIIVGEDKKKEGS